MTTETVDFILAYVTSAAGPILAPRGIIWTTLVEVY